MCNYRQWIYEVIPEGSYPIIKNCPGCGKKTAYYNTNCFRVNASKSKIDVWLIYHCGCCKHTLNLTIFERESVKNIDRTKYQQFLNNDEGLANACGRDKGLFAKNKVMVDAEGMTYRLKLLSGSGSPGAGSHIIIKNPWELKLRTDKLLAGLLKLTRNKEKEMEKHGHIKVLKDDKKELSVLVRLPFEAM